MKRAGRSFAVLWVAVWIGSLAGCATQAPSPDGRLQFPQYQFSVARPPAEWAPVDSKIPGEFAAWTTSVSKSRLGIQAHRPVGDGSLRAVVEAFKASMTRTPAPRGVLTFTLKEEKEINLGGRTFHRVILGNNATPADFVFYFLRGNEFAFSLSLAVFPGDFEKDLAVLEQMARSVGS
jgi:hypothetical protein